MTDILAKIVAAKKIEVAQRQADRSVEELADSLLYNRQVTSLKTALEHSDHYGIIAEFKRKSPSQSNINTAADPVGIAHGYQAAQVAAMSVLTDYEFFGAHPADFARVREQVNLPMIRKDFMVDPYQIHEARAMGADAILLIAACLETSVLDELAITAKTLGLDVLCEVHGEDELAKISPAVDIVGVNNRNLKDFSVSISQSIELAPKIPTGMLKISESGIEDPQAVVQLRQEGYRGFLIGTYFMRQPDPGQACSNFITEVRRIDELYKDAIA